MKFKGPDMCTYLHTNLYLLTVRLPWTILTHTYTHTHTHTYTYSLGASHCLLKAIVAFSNKFTLFHQDNHPCFTGTLPNTQNSYKDNMAVVQGPAQMQQCV